MSSLSVIKKVAIVSGVIFASYSIYCYMFPTKKIQTIVPKQILEFKENLEILKDYILLYYRSIPRGKLEITSNFYKVLEVVDINKFYEKGEY